MGTPQLTYGVRTDAFIGQFGYGHRQGIVRSRAAETATIDFGLVVSGGTDPDTQCVVGGTAPLGIALRDPAQPMVDATDDGQYIATDTVSIVDRDYVWVTTASTSGSYRDTVLYNEGTGALTVGTPDGTNKPIGYVEKPFTAAGLMLMYVDTDLFTGALAIDGAPVDNADIAANKILKYNDTTENLEYEDDAIA